MSVGNSYKQSSGGLFVPQENKTVCIFFEHGGRVTIEATKCEVSTDANGKLTKLDIEGPSSFPFLRLDAIQAIEFVK